MDNRRAEQIFSQRSGDMTVFPITSLTDTHITHESQHTAGSWYPDGSPEHVVHASESRTFLQKKMTPLSM